MISRNAFEPSINPPSSFVVCACLCCALCDASACLHQYGRVRALEVLLRHPGIWLDAPSHSGQTALHYAAEMGRLSCTTALLSSGKQQPHGGNLMVADAARFDPSSEESLGLAGASADALSFGPNPQVTQAQLV